MWSDETECLIAIQLCHHYCVLSRHYMYLCTLMYIWMKWFSCVMDGQDVCHIVLLKLLFCIPSYIQYNHETLYTM